VSPSRVAIFAPNPVLTVTLEQEGAGEAARPSIHFHAGGQGVWTAAMAHTLGAVPVLCGLLGGESGELLRPLLGALTGGVSDGLVQAASPSGCYVTDRRSGEREVLAMTLSDPPSRHELDELLSLACAQALSCGWMVVTNPLPPEALPLEVYGELVANARAGGARTLVDLSSPRLDSALEGRPDLVKIDEWQLAEFVRGPVSTPALLRAAAERLIDAGAGCAVITRGSEPALVLRGGEALWLVPPRFENGFAEGCGDAMMGALTASWAREGSLERALVVGAAAGAANFLRRGLGHASAPTVQRLAERVRLEPWSSARAA
jgi:1-phosphofructokinase